MKIEALAFVHGHTHADHIDREEDISIISVGCSKIEYFEDKKPEESWPQSDRREVSQELVGHYAGHHTRWAAGFLRFGAGI